MFHVMIFFSSLLRDFKPHDFKTRSKRKSSEDIALKWMTAWSRQNIHEVENICMKPMVKLGYGPFTYDLMNRREILFKNAYDVWPYI